MGLANASRKRGDGHADIGGDDLGAWAKSAHRPIGVMARLPELGAFLGTLSPAKLPSPFVCRNRGEGLDLLARACRRAVEFEKQRRRFGEREMRVGIARPDLHRVGKLDAGERQPHLHGGDGGVAGAFDGGERDRPRKVSVSGIPCSLSVSSVMMPSVPSEPTKRRVRS